MRYNGEVTLIDSISRNIPSLKKAEIAGLLYLIKNMQPLTNSQLVRLTGLPKEELRRFKLSLSDILVETDEDSISFSEKGLALIKELHLSPYSWSLLPNISKNNSLEERLKEIRKTYDLTAKREYDQWFATEDTSINKLNIMKEKGCLEGSRVLLLGDDDLVSSVLALSKIEVSKLTVLDIDSTLLNTINKVSSTNSMQNITTDVYDAREQIPSKYFGQYDVVVTDPPYTKAGVTLFLNRAIEFLNGSDKYIFFYYGNSFKSPEKTLKIQEIISRMGLLIEDKIDKFSRYYGAESIGSASSLYILKTTPYTKVIPNPSIIDNIYTFEDRGEEKFPFIDHVTIKVNKVPNNIFQSRNTMLSLLGKFCDTHKLKVVDTVVTEFKGKGLTITFVLSTSNLVVHTWPEFNALHLDLITCSPIFKKNEIVDTIRQLFNTISIELNIIE